MPSLEEEEVGSGLLVTAGFMSLAVALFHVVAAFVPRLQRSFGAPESLIAAGPLAIGVACFALTALFSIWAAYAFSGAGWLPNMPFLGLALLAIGAVYALRGTLLGPQLLAVAGRWPRDIQTEPQHLVSSAVSLTIGLVYLAGTLVSWSELGG